ncbi:MAG: efflux RND transporter periplasmic adaptor subunit [Myxococcales bacterium]|nr:efflux RND transporter periplasmic adaptor subunit [Myxococcales bacterium]
MSESGNRPEADPGHDEPMPEGEEQAPPGVQVMAAVRWALVALMAIAAVGSVLYVTGTLGRLGPSQPSETIYYCPMHPSVVQDHPGECPICSMTLVPKEADGGEVGTPAASGHAGHSSAPSTEAEAPYYCPMHPEETSSDPQARCPKCGMTLEPRPADAHGSHGGHAEAPPEKKGVPGLVQVQLTPERIQLLGMRTAKVERAALSGELRTVGVVAASEAGQASITTRFAGWIEELEINQTGQKVTKGQVLASVYSPELLTAQQEFLNARRWAESSESSKGAHGLSADLEGDARRKLELLGVSPNEIEELEQSRRPVRALRLRSPANGYVTRKNAVLGMHVQPGSQLFEVADLSTVWVLADVYEHEMRRLFVGQKASVSLSAYPGESFAGKVAFIYPTVDPTTRTLRARLELRNPKLRLRPGMYGDVVLQLPAEEGLLAPAEAVVDTGEVQYVFITLDGGRFEPRRVKVGARSGDRVQLLEGVAEGEVVVTTANFLVDSESRLRAAIGEATGSATGQSGAKGCDQEIDRQRYPDKYEQCRACEVQHRGMGAMEADCKAAIPKPWK